MTSKLSAQHMSALIDDLLKFSRMGRTVLSRTTVNLDRLIRDIVQSLRQDTEGRVIAWTIGALPDVFGDPSPLSQVLANLLGNAVKYTLPRAEARIDIGSWNAMSAALDEAVIFVRGNGVGFACSMPTSSLRCFSGCTTPANSKAPGSGWPTSSASRLVMGAGPGPKERWIAT